jgi:hypothetical protein
MALSAFKKMLSLLLLALLAPYSSAMEQQELGPGILNQSMQSDNQCDDTSQLQLEDVCDKCWMQRFGQEFAQGDTGMDLADFYMDLHLACFMAKATAGYVDEPKTREYRRAHKLWGRSEIAQLTGLLRNLNFHLDFYAEDLDDLAGLLANPKNNHILTDLFNDFQDIKNAVASMGEFHGMDPLLDFSEEAKAERETLKKELGKALSFKSSLSPLMGLLNKGMLQKFSGDELVNTLNRIAAHEGKAADVGAAKRAQETAQEALRTTHAAREAAAKLVVKEESVENAALTGVVAPKNVKEAKQLIRQAQDVCGAEGFSGSLPSDATTPMSSNFGGGFFLETGSFLRAKARWLDARGVKQFFRDMWHAGGFHGNTIILLTVIVGGILFWFLWWLMCILIGLSVIGGLYVYFS